MPARKGKAREQVHHHRDGTIRAKGQTVDGVATGYRAWFRKDGTKMRSGRFEDGRQVGEWTTYDRTGQVVKVTTMKARPEGEPAAPATAPASASAVDRYLAALPAEQRRALERLRRTIRTAAPGAEECISYQLPAFRLDGRVLVGFGAAAKHCAFYPMSGSTVRAFAAELEDHDTSKGTIRFPAARPLQAALVRKLVQARIAENAARKAEAAARASRRRARRSR
jgi:uncharacterized protein YdhG (YjbR/CyaY superfamily)